MRWVLDTEDYSRQSVFAVELKPNSWLIFTHSPYDRDMQKVLSSLVIK